MVTLLRKNNSITVMMGKGPAGSSNDLPALAGVKSRAL
jgi:hypothetical protein